ncbi:MAG: META domain-containing protein [Bacteroidota bacterium]
MLKTQLRGKDWQVVAMIIDNERIEGGTVADAAPYINFSDRVIDLVAYCNAYKGTYLLEKDHFFKVTFQSGIRIECEGDIALYEKILINILKNANKIILDNHQLSIFQTDQTFLFLAPK